MDENELLLRGSKVKLIISDMDGTLLTDQKEITQYSCEIIKLLKEIGIEFSICTGRINTMIEHYIKQLQIESPIITANGAAIWDPANKKFLYEKLLMPSEVLKILEFCDRNQLDGSVLTPKVCYFTKYSKRIRRFEAYNNMAQQSGTEKIPLMLIDRNYESIVKSRIHKMLIYAFDSKQAEMIQQFLNSLETITYTSSDENLFDILALGVSKKNGVLKLIEHRNLVKSQTCIFGDYFNDVEMIQATDLFFAMKNGCSELRNLASKVTDSNNEDGVAKAIFTYIIKTQKGKRA